MFRVDPTVCSRNNEGSLWVTTMDRLRDFYDTLIDAICLKSKPAGDVATRLDTGPLEDRGRQARTQSRISEFGTAYRRGHWHRRTTRGEEQEPPHRRSP